MCFHNHLFQGCSLTTRLTTLFLYGDDAFKSFTNPVTATPVGAADGSETTFQYTFPEILGTESVATRTDAAIIIVSSPGFRELQSAAPLAADTITWSGWSQALECVSTHASGNQGKCMISRSDFASIPTGTGIPWSVYVVESDGEEELEFGSSSQSMTLLSSSSSESVQGFSSPALPTGTEGQSTG
ncbi:hypothetical protein VKT23_012391 [Stygiomarasmius scandens]|uniref:Uncharacterized protein n=1 Tax=Marasmiellus scandens TaxID=2682957 RepID=A0ABR1JA01_9AGAR